jgi:hypothetical protein
MYMGVVHGGHILVHDLLGMILYFIDDISFVS